MRVARHTNRLAEIVHFYRRRTRSRHRSTAAGIDAASPVSLCTRDQVLQKETMKKLVRHKESRLAAAVAFGARSEVLSPAGKRIESGG